MFTPMVISGLTVDPLTNSPIVILKEVDGERTLPIWIGLLEATAIASELEGIKFSRPMTHDLLKNIMETIELKINKIEVCELYERMDRIGCIACPLVGAKRQKIELEMYPTYRKKYIKTFEKISELLKEENAENITVTAGGFLEEGDISRIKAMGVKEFFPKGTSFEELI